MTASCTKFLTEEPKTFSSPEVYYSNIEEMQSAVNGCYDGLQVIFASGIGVALNGHVFFEGLTGLSWREQSGGYQDMGFTLPVKVNEDGVNAWVWRDYYKAIENCNSTIHGIETSTADVAEAQRNTLLSEVYFLRAYYYWRLTSMFGPVPYKTTMTTGVAGAALPLDTQETVIDGCIADLKHAEELVANDAWNRTDGHVSKGAIKALLAKVYMSRAGYPINDSSAYALAYEKAKEVVNSGAFSLFDTYADLRNPENENTREHLFSIQREGEHAINVMTVTTYPLTDPLLTPRSAGGGGFVPNKSFVDSYAEGPRKDGFFYTEYIAYEDSTLLTFEPHVFKFFDETEGALKKGEVGLDYWVIRYADVLLTLAEAKVQADGGSTSDQAAVDAYWQVRSRAVTGEEQPSILHFDQVFKERVWELAFENITWFDMIRTQKAYNPVSDQVVNFIGHQAEGHSGYTFKESDIYLPYPVREKKYNPNLVR